MRPLRVGCVVLDVRNRGSLIWQGSSGKRPGAADLSALSSVRHADLCLPVRPRGPGRPGADVQEGPVRGEHPGVSSTA